VLFDLQSPGRRRLIKVVYATLALLFGVGFLFFFIGSDVGGGQSVFEAVGIGGSSNDDPFEDQIKDAQAAVEANPQDANARAALAQLYVQAGNQKLEVDEATQQPVPTEESIEQYTLGADAWDAYLKLKPKQPDTTLATQIAQAYFSLAQASDSASEAQQNAASAADAQEIVADANPNLGSLSFLAQYLYIAGRFSEAEAAAKKAEAGASPAQVQELKAQLAQLKKIGEGLSEQVTAEAKAAKGGGGASGAPAGENPLSGGSLGGPSDSGGLAPAPSQ
jgi:tetratricopeptide (TPR) repeat protein